MSIIRCHIFNSKNHHLGKRWTEAVIAVEMSRTTDQFPWFPLHCSQRIPITLLTQERVDGNVSVTLLIGSCSVDGVPLVGKSLLMCRLVSSCHNCWKASLSFIVQWTRLEDCKDSPVTHCTHICNDHWTVKYVKCLFVIIRLRTYLKQFNTKLCLEVLIYTEFPTQINFLLRGGSTFYQEWFTVLEIVIPNTNAAYSI